MKEDTPIERIWAYVHGEMEVSERVAIEQAAAEDPELAAELERLESLNANLRQLIPLAEWTDQELEDRVLEALEQDLPDEEEAGRPAAEPIAFPTPGIDISAWAIRLWSTGIAAAAASLFIFGGVVHHLNGPIGWSQPEFAVTQYRGADEFLYSMEDAATCLSALKKALHDEYTRLAPGKTRWQLRFRFGETPATKLKVEIHATDGRPAPVRQWAEEYDSVAGCLAGSGELAKRVAGDLADPK